MRRHQEVPESVCPAEKAEHQQADQRVGSRE